MSTAETPPVTDERDELERLAEQLATRRSITLLAAGSILAFFGTIAFGVSMLLLAQSARLPHFFWPLLAVFLATLTGSLLCYIRGLRLRKKERAEFERFQALRARLGLE